MQKPRPFDFPLPLGALALIGLVVVAYVPVWHAGFIWDDDINITSNSLVQGGVEGLARLWRGQTTDYYPLTWTLFWGEWRLFGDSSTAFHVVNVALDAIGAVLVWRVLERLEIRGAWLAAALFAVQPVNLASVAWVTEGKNTLSLIFAALAVLAYLHWDDARKPAWYGVGLVAFLAALMSKASVTPLPLVLLTCIWWRRHDSFSLKKDGVPLLPWIALSTATVCLAMWFHVHRVLGTDIVHPEGWLARIAGAGRAAWHYAWTEIFPYDLSIIYPRWDINPRNLIAWLPLIGWILVLATLYRLRKKWGRGPLAQAICWLLLLSPVLGFFDIYYMRYSLVADHWQYLASIVGMTALASTIFLAPARVASLLGLTCICLLTLLTNLQASAYENSEVYWRAALAHNPSSYLVWMNLGRAITDKPDHEDEAEEDYREAVRLRPDDAVAHNFLAIMLRRKGKTDEAIANYEAATDLKPDFANAHYNLGVALKLVGRSDEAVVHFQKAVDLEPDNLVSRLNLTSALIDAARYREAIAQADEGLKMDPKDPAFTFDRGLAQERDGDLTGALTTYQETLQNTPRFIPAMTRVAWIRATAPLDSMRNGQEALKLATIVCDSLENKDFGALDALGAAYAELGKFSDAVNMAQRALRLAPPAERAAIEKRIGLYNTLQPFRSAEETRTPKS